MKAYRRLLMTFLVLTFWIPTLSANAAGTATQLFNPPFASMTLTSSLPNPVLIGGEITFDLAFSVGNLVPGVTGAEVYLGYDPALTAPPTTPGQTAAEVLPDFFGVSNFSINEMLPAAQCPTGVSPCVHLVVLGPQQTYQTGIVARFHFRALATGSACFQMLQASMKDADGYAVTFTPAAPYCQQIQDRTTTGTVRRQGVPANPNPGGGTLACSSVTAAGVWTYGPVSTDAAGVFSFGNLPNGTYSVRALYPGYLASQKTGVVIPNNSLAVDVGTTTLQGGDVNNDNVINILDIGYVISKFGLTGVGVRSATPGNCGASEESADINDDGTVNISDLAIAAGNWGKVGPTPWQ